MADTTMGSKVKEEVRNNPSMEKARESGSQAVNQAKDAASSVGQMASHAATAAGQLAGQAASSVGHMAGQAAASVGHMASQAASTVGKTADNLTASAGSGIRSFGDTISKDTPHDGILGAASQSVANTIKESGKYIEDAKLSGMLEDVSDLIRRNPMPAILIGVGVGYLIGRAMGSSRS